MGTLALGPRQEWLCTGQWAQKGNSSTYPAFPVGTVDSPLVLTGRCGEGVGDGEGDEEKDRDLEGRKRNESTRTV